MKNNNLIEGKENFIKIFKEAELTAIYSPMAQINDMVFGYFDSGKTKKHWGLSYQSVAQIYANKDINVNPQTHNDPYGIFKIGTHHNWVYDKKIHPNPEILQEKIIELLKFSLIGGKTSDSIAINVLQENIVMTCDWSKYKTDLSENDIQVFNKATDELIGVKYTPIAVSKQKVEGMNYSFFCNANVIYSAMPNETALIRIYEDNSGKITLSNIKRISKV